MKFWEMRKMSESVPIWSLLPEQTEVHLKHGLEQAHVGALVQPDLVLPEVDDEHLGRGEREQRRFAFKVLYRQDKRLAK